MTATSKEFPIRIFLPATPAQLDLGLVLLRIVLGVIVVGLGLAADMVGAIVLVHAKAGFFLQGVEFVLALFGGAAALALGGAGRYSVDHAVAARPSGSRSV